MLKYDVEEELSYYDIEQYTINVIDLTSTICQSNHQLGYIHESCFEPRSSRRELSPKQNNEPGHNFREPFKHVMAFEKMIRVSRCKENTWLMMAGFLDVQPLNFFFQMNLSFSHLISNAQPTDCPTCRSPALKRLHEAGRRPRV